MKRIALVPYRRWLVLALLLAVLALSWLLEPPALDDVDTESAGPEVAVREAKERTDLALPIHAGDAAVEAAPPLPAERVADVFAVRTWEPPEPPVASQTAPVSAPPLPFKFLGRIDEPGKEVVFMLEDGERVVVVGVGDAIGRNYRVEKYENGQLLFRYRPMNIRQALAVGNT